MYPASDVEFVVLAALLIKYWSKNARLNPARIFKFIYRDFITSTLRVLGRTFQH
jgi:hypothetical protein